MRTQADRVKMETHTVPWDRTVGRGRERSAGSSRQFSAGADGSGRSESSLYATVGEYQPVVDERASWRRRCLSWVVRASSLGRQASRGGGPTPGRGGSEGSGAGESPLGELLEPLCL